MAPPILCTHTGSLPRPPALTRLHARRASGEAIPAAVAEIVLRRIAARPRMRQEIARFRANPDAQERVRRQAAGPVGGDGPAPHAAPDRGDPRQAHHAAELSAASVVFSASGLAPCGGWPDLTAPPTPGSPPMRRLSLPAAAGRHVRDEVRHPARIGARIGRGG